MSKPTTHDVTTCRDCPWAIVYERADYWCEREKRNVLREEVPGWCPLREAPSLVQLARGVP